MSNGRHALHLSDEKLAIFHAESGSEVRLDVPLVNVIHESHDVRWLWRDRIPLGRVTLIEGGARSGKSFVAFDLAARVSGGIAWPDSPQAEPGGDNAQPLHGCLLVCLQDNPSDTLGRRLQVAGGDPNRLRHFSQFLSTDLKKRQSIRAARFPGDLAAFGGRGRSCQSHLQPGCRVRLHARHAQVRGEKDRRSQATNRRPRGSTLAMVAPRGGVEFEQFERWKTDCGRSGWREHGPRVRSDWARGSSSDRERGCGNDFWR